MGDFVIGQKVAIYQNDYSVGRFTTATVERDTKLYWIANGRKFRKSDGLEPGERGAWSRATYLLPLDDKRVIAAEVAARRSAAYGKVLRAQDELAKDRENVERIADLKTALDEYTATLNYPPFEPI